MTDLDLHPAAEVVPEEVGGDGVEHVHLVRLEGDRLLVEVVPANKQYSTVQYSTVQCSTVQYSTVQYSTVLLRSSVPRTLVTPADQLNAD